MDTAPEIVSIDIAKAKAKLALVETEARRLRDFIQQAAEFSAEKTSAKSSPPRSRAGRPRDDSTYQTILDAIRGLPDQFDSLTLKAKLNGHPYEKHKVRGAMIRLMEDGFINEVQKPAGVRPGVFRKVNDKSA